MEGSPQVCPPLYCSQRAGGGPWDRALGRCVFYLFLLRHKSDKLLGKSLA